MEGFKYPASRISPTFARANKEILTMISLLNFDQLEADYTDNRAIVGKTKIVTMQEMVQCVLWFSERKSVTMVQQNYRQLYARQPPCKRTIRQWFQRFLETGKPTVNRGVYLDMLEQYVAPQALQPQVIFQQERMQVYWNKVMTIQNRKQLIILATDGAECSELPSLLWFQNTLKTYEPAVLEILSK
uniref:DUF4817 domain-containing protein n=1 Tax=Strigamia maritima TaxID=126957 RepID=T1J9D6_STRMM